MQSDNPSEDTLKHVSSFAGFTECHRTPDSLHVEQGKCFDL